ncbi:MAG: 2-oxoacid:acceptor oxidoreductase subunit alpha [SAR324 cluster bacterium]|jgi:2-oxoglutarate ferredoxin oxidoreductase subunit alpha|nr:2-oxoacid:acceptor oxidoreductase subunit alpha [SAR324 cluster bacterium]
MSSVQAPLLKNSVPTQTTFPETELEKATIRFAGDSGDGMQLTGTRFTTTSVIAGNDVITFPDYPAEIRAPAGTLAGVSSFDLSFSSNEIYTTADKLSVLVAMNPAALKTNSQDLEKGGILIVNSDSFAENDLRKAEYSENPLESGELNDFRVVQIPITKLTLKAVEETGLSHRDGSRSKNFFALGVVNWLFVRSLEQTQDWIKAKFKKKPDVAKANSLALQAGYNYAITIELFQARYFVPPAVLPSGDYRQITGNQALALGCVAASHRSGLSLVYSSYPITPASDILHELAQYKNFGVKTIQAEDEIAAMSSSIGSAFGGVLAVTGTSGPGFDLKSEALGYAVMTELPVVVLNVQRGGPSTGLPTKAEQTDLLAAMYGRHGEAPVPVLAPATPGDCFFMVLEAFRIALKYMTPVIVLSDGGLANASEPWKIPDVQQLPDLTPSFHTDPENFSPYHRNQQTLARNWAIPGTPGLEHRIGGLEKDSETGEINYEPENHEKMVLLRDEKIRRIVRDLPQLKIIGSEKNKLLVVTWGSVFGPAFSAIEELQAEGYSVSMLHLRHLFPFQENLGEILRKFEKVLVPEMNLGQLSRLLRAEYLVDAISFSKLQGRHFLISEIRNRVLEILGNS